MGLESTDYTVPAYEYATNEGLEVFANVNTDNFKQTLSDLDKGYRRL